MSDFELLLLFPRHFIFGSRLILPQLDTPYQLVKHDEYDINEQLLV